MPSGSTSPFADESKPSCGGAVFDAGEEDWDDDGDADVDVEALSVDRPHPQATTATTATIPTALVAPEINMSISFIHFRADAISPPDRQLSDPPRC